MRVWYNRNIEKACKYCKKQFISYISFKRKYCSKRCCDKDKIGKFCSLKTINKMSLATKRSWNNFQIREKRSKGISFSKQGFKHHLWKGGKIDDGNGYVIIYMPNHPFVNHNNHIREHRFIMEKYIGRYLHRWEIVHHINGTRNDNRIENLKLCANKSEHQKIHELAKKIIKE